MAAPAAPIANTIAHVSASAASSPASAPRRSAAVLVALTESDLRSRYGRGKSVLLKWLFDPFFALGVYFILVATMLNKSGHARALVIACSVVPFQLVMTSFTSSLHAIRLRRSILTNMRFDRGLLPLSTVLTETVAFGAALTLLPATMALSGVSPTPYAFWLLALIPETILLAIAFAYPATIFGILYPDLRSFAVSAVRTLYFLAPSLVALESVHGVTADLLKLNPLSGLFEGYRAALLYGETPPLWSFVIPLAYCAASLAIFLPLYRVEAVHFAKVVE
jgi:lipopolysaccharide transport system permease protein